MMRLSRRLFGVQRTRWNEALVTQVDPYATFVDRLVNPIYDARWISPGTAPIRI